MGDINSYADGLLLDFCDAVHLELKRILKGHFGDNWLESGVQKHFAPDYFARVDEMLRSPMRAVEMDKSADEMYGIEHLWNIINGNWRAFEPLFQDRVRTQAYLSEITELRHNLAHRRKRHVLLRSNLIRVMGSCQTILSALDSPRLDSFTSAVDSLSSGGTPWGSVLAGHLPPSDEMYAEFIGRPGELEGLSEWLASDSPQILVWGYGGVGKSALAYKFARDVRDSSNESLIAVCWVSAKKTEYSEGSARERSADFVDLSSFLTALWRAMYGPQDNARELTPEIMVEELQQMPVLLVVDDFDTISEDVELTEFLLYRLRNTPTRVICTSRHRTPTLKNLEVPPFSGDELRDFVLRKSVDYSVDQHDCIGRLSGIESVTGGYPLFVEDLIHYAAFVGIDEALQHWSQRKGDAARQYALQRQIEYLSRSSGEVLIALSVANRALRIVEISGVAGLTDDDAEAGISELRRWRMVNEVREDDSESPVFRMNNNTSRLVQQTFKDDGRVKTFLAAFKALTGERIPEAKKIAIAKIIGQTKELAKSDSFEAAEKHLLDSMTGELENSADLYGFLGCLYSNQQPLELHAQKAQAAFLESYRLGSSKIDTFFHWAELERKLAESMITNARDMEISDEAISEQWKRCEEAATKGIERCGSSQILCYLAGYGASREANARNRANSFSYAQGAYSRSIDWYNKALTAPVSDVATIDKGMVFRGLTLAYGGTEDFEQLLRTLRLSRASSGLDATFQSEYKRLLHRYPRLRNDPEFRGLSGPVVP